MGLLKTITKKRLHQSEVIKTGGADLETEQLLLEMKQIRYKLRELYSAFNETRNPIEIEDCINSMQVFEEKHRILLEEMRKKQIRQPAYSFNNDGFDLK